MPDNYQFVKIRSWHVLSTFTRAPGQVRTMCGRTIDAATVRDDFPQHEKSCESCFRRIVK